MSPRPEAPRRPKLLVVDDGDRYVELAHALLRDYDYATRCSLPGPCWTCPARPGCTLTHAHDAREADAALAQHPDVDVVLLDVAFDVPEARLLPSTERDLERRRRLQGVAILAHLRRTRGALPVILMTSEGELAYEDAAEALAVDEFVTLAGEAAFDARALSLLIERVLARQREAPEAGGYAWGGTAPMARLRRDAVTLARTSLPMLLVGETGTGKSALAERVIHPATGRRGPFVAVDLSALPESLVAAELFGTARGAFSGAVERAGRFEQAQGGTLLLDELGNLSLELQRTLLLVLQDARVTRLGESTARPVDVKVIAATHTDLDEAVRRGTFRADLLARLNPAARLRMQPLRERVADLPELARAFVKKAFAAGADRALLARYLEAAHLTPPARSGAPDPRAEPPHAELAIGRPRAVPSRGVVFVLAPASLRALSAHPWPGNVRELELLLRTAVVSALSDALTAAESRPARAASRRAPGADPARLIPLPARLVRELLAASSAPGRIPFSAPQNPILPNPDIDAPNPTHSFRVRPGDTAHDVAADLERQLYERLFAESNGDFTAMARALLRGDPAQNARRVRLRFNQLGLRVRGGKPR
jgi:two-component system nitrogen regulation response regulator GlnG